MNWTSRVHWRLSSSGSSSWPCGNWQALKSEKYRTLRRIDSSTFFVDKLQHSSRPRRNAYLPGVLIASVQPVRVAVTSPYSRSSHFSGSIRQAPGLLSKMAWSSNHLISIESACPVLSRPSLAQPRESLSSKTGPQPGRPGQPQGARKCLSRYFR